MFAIVAIIAAMDAEPEAMDTISPVDILRASGFEGTTISQPGSGFTPRPRDSSWRGCPSRLPCQRNTSLPCLV